MDDGQMDTLYIYRYTGSTETFGHMLSPAFCSFECHSLSLVQIFVWFPLVLSKVQLTSHKRKTSMISSHQNLPT